jgi:hypothetical protein
MKAWAGLAVTLLLAAAGGFWHLSGETADTKRRVDTVEKRQLEDRHELKADQKEIKQDVKETKEQVQQIRILLERMGREREHR